MNDEAVTAALDAHDALVKACLEGELQFDEFVMAYGTFPSGLQKEAGSLERFRKRLTFHAQVAGIVAGLGNQHIDSQQPPGGAQEFIEKAAVARLRQLVARYPAALRKNARTL
jgi:hypothetical protein